MKKGEFAIYVARNYRRPIGNRDKIREAYETRSKRLTRVEQKGEYIKLGHNFDGRGRSLFETPEPSSNWEDDQEFIPNREIEEVTRFSETSPKISFPIVFPKISRRISVQDHSQL